MNPDFLNSIYETLCNSTSKYLLICEYYNPVPVKINYRGNEDKLFKRDLAGEILDTFQEFKLKDYGFSYHRDPSFPQDDFNWFLLEKK